MHHLYNKNGLLKPKRLREIVSSIPIVDKIEKWSNCHVCDLVNEDKNVGKMVNLKQILLASSESPISWLMVDSKGESIVVSVYNTTQKLQKHVNSKKIDHNNLKSFCTKNIVGQL